MKRVVFSDDVENYLSYDIQTERELKHAVAKTYTKSWSLTSTVDGSPYVIGTATVDTAILPHPELRFGRFTASHVNVTCKNRILFITFT